MLFQSLECYSLDYIDIVASANLLYVKEHYEASQWLWNS